MSTARNIAHNARYRWRVIDITVTAVIGVASGVLFWLWDLVCTVPLAIFSSVSPGFEGLLNGFWLFAGPLAAIIVRKPGAALFAETVGAFVELTLGNQWGVGASFVIGILQGLAAELAFAFFAYRVWNLMTVMLSGALSGVACGAYYWVTNPGWGTVRASIYVGTSIIGGTICGAVVWLLCRAIARTGALASFPYMQAQASTNN